MLRDAFTIGARLDQKRRWRFATGAILLAIALYSSERALGARTVTVEEVRASRDTVMDTVRVVERRLRVDTVRVRETERVAEQRRGVFDSVAQSVTAASAAGLDPAALAMPAIQSCQQALAADTIAYRAVAANLQDMTEDRDAQRQRAADDERELRVGSKRLGFRSGFAVGLALVAAIHVIVR